MKSPGPAAAAVAFWVAVGCSGTPSTTVDSKPAEDVAVTGSDGDGAVADMPSAVDGSRQDATDADGPGADQGSSEAPPDGADAAPAQARLRPSLAAAIGLQTGVLPTGLVLADFDGDGKLDVAVGHSGDTFVSVLINKDGHSFAPPANYQVGGMGSGIWIKAADLNGDGRPDLAVSVFNDPEMSSAGNRTVALVNAGDGTFGAARKVADGAVIALAPLDGDDRADLVVANQGNANVLVNDGQGLTFRAAGTYPVGAEAVAAAVGDLDRDGKLDLAVTSLNDVNANPPPANFGNIVVLLNLGGAMFRKVTYPRVNGANEVEIGDISGDGAPDLIVTDFGGSGDPPPLVLVNKGDGSFANPTPLDMGLPRGTMMPLVVRDFDGDGRIDLALSGGGTARDIRTVKILRNLGGGSFAPSRTHNVATELLSLAAGDMDGDGAPDFVLATGVNRHVGVLLGYGDGTFPAGPSFSAVEGASMATGDIDGDGKRDIVVTRRNGNVSVYRNDGRGAFLEPLESAAPRASQLVLADLNGDGKPDLAMAGVGAIVLLNQGGSSFADAAKYPTRPSPSLSPGTPEAIAAGDVNGDGAPDLVTLDTADSGDSATVGNPLSVLLNNKDGTFLAPATYAVDATRARAGSLALADLNSDGAVDLVVAASGKAVQVLINRGDGTFLPPVAYQGTAPAVVSVGDLNGDGKPDLAFVDAGVPTIRLNSGAGVFGAARAAFPASAGGGRQSVVLLVDLNRDGKLDLLTTGDGLLGIALGRQDGTFETPLFYLNVGNLNVGNTPELELAAADFNGDGKVDVALRSFPGFSVVLNDGT